MAYTEFCSCPGCSGNLVYSIRHDSLYCEKCDSYYSVREYDKTARRKEQQEKLPGAENDTAPAASEEKFSCPSCGGSISPGVLGNIGKCPFCDNYLIFSGKIKRQREPDLILPFKKDREDFLEALWKYFRNAPFVPDGFKKYLRSPDARIQAKYVPFWVYNIAAEGKMSYSSPYDEKRGVRRRGSYEANASMQFRGIPEKATRNADDEMIRKLEPIDTSEAEPFSYSYLSGLDTEICKTDDTGSYRNARIRALNSMYQAMAPYGRGKNESQDISIFPQSVFCVLAPIWTLEFYDREKIITVAMNGHSGAVAADNLMDSTVIVLIKLTQLLMVLFIVMQTVFLGLQSYIPVYDYLAKLPRLPHVQNGIVMIGALLPYAAFMIALLYIRTLLSHFLFKTRRRTYISFSTALSGVLAMAVIFICAYPKIPFGIWVLLGIFVILPMCMFGYGEIGRDIEKDMAEYNDNIRNDANCYIDRSESDWNVFKTDW
ncbi:APC family permease [Succinimonas amylolytica]|uniref:APC family permease n=1 Tax=Succinimonas amylolytica TaxID=83769 RepID=UPI00036C8617|nr:APC family permease [Succinimonas amylolytica]